MQDQQKRPERQLGIGQIKDSLEHQIHRLKDLQDKLSDEGERLSPQDRKLLKTSMLPMLEDVLDEVKFSYLMGNVEYFKDNSNFIQKFTQFMD